MTDPAPLIIALILDHPLCRACVVEKSCLTEDGVSAALQAIESALVLGKHTDRCAGCGQSERVYSFGRPPLA